MAAALLPARVATWRAASAAFTVAGPATVSAASPLAGAGPRACASAPGRWRGPTAAARLGGGPRRGFATAAFSVAAEGESKAQALFVVGLNKGKFFGQDSAEEGLKLVERVATHHSEYQLLFDLTERELAEVERQHKVKNQRLTPSRELEGARHGEMIPLVQAGMVDKRPRKGLGRPLKVTQARVAWFLWKHPREAVKLYWAYWRRKEYKDAAAPRFWREHFPVSATGYFDERAGLLAIRAVEQLLALREQQQEGAAVLVVGSDIFDLVVEHLRPILGEDAPAKLKSAEFQKQLRDTAAELCVEVPDLTPLLVFVYLCLPALFLQFLYLGVESYVNHAGVLDEVLKNDDRE